MMLTWLVTAGVFVTYTALHFWLKKRAARLKVQRELREAAERAEARKGQLRKDIRRLLDERRAAATTPIRSFAPDTPSQPFVPIFVGSDEPRSHYTADLVGLQTGGDVQPFDGFTGGESGGAGGGSSWEAPSCDTSYSDSSSSSDSGSSCDAGSSSSD